MELYLIRHGETEWNKERRLQGQADIALDAFGRELAEETKEGLKDIHFDVCFTSPLKRAKETAEIILAGTDTPIIEDERIIEMGFAEYEGKCCSKEGWELPESFRAFFHDPVNFMPAEGGEDFATVKKRTKDFLDWLTHTPEYEDKTVLLATHGVALAGILNNIKNLPLEEYWGIGVHKNCAVTKIEIQDDVATIIYENRAFYKEEVKDW
ncbi:MAG: histidine phosphatase family protein [Lachnospiraceae bacterium]|nr:histidine phosphatase family protein [Lachnospiraceae bacterium]